MFNFHKNVHAHVSAYKYHYASGAGIFTFLAVLFLSIGYIRSTFAAVTTTGATSGTNISADKAANSSSGSAYTLLGGITITEGANGDLPANQSGTNLILTAPSNWRFRAGSGSVGFLGTSTSSADITATSIVVTSSTIIVTLSTDNNANKSDTLNITGIRVQAISGNLIPSAGNILRTCANSGTAVIAGITCNSTNFGSLSQITGTVTDTTPPTAFVTYIPGSGSYTSGNVVATLTGFSETGVTITNNSGSANRTFTTGGSFTFTFQDPSGNTGSATATVTWIDKTAPVVTLSGPSNVVVQLNNTYTEQGATWTDNIDGNGILTGPTAGSVNTAALGTYTLTYGKTDAVGNYGFAQRSVEITGSTPVVSLNGANPYNIEFGSGTYTEYGATRTDTIDVSGTVTDIVSTVVIGTLGNYTVTYTKVNTSGVTGNAVRTVNVKDTIPPVVTIVGSGTVTVEYGSNYVESGVQRGDLHAGAGDITTITAISGTVNTGTLGTYTLDYIKADVSGNTGHAYRTVIVQDTIAPTLTLSASNTSPTNSSIHMTAQFSESVTGFISSDISIANGSITGFVKVNGTNYTFDVTPASQGIETVDVLSGVCTDISGKPNVAASQFSITYDTTVPGITFTSHTSGQSLSSTLVTLTGTSSDTNGIVTVKVNGNIATGTTSWSKTIPLSGGTNTITVQSFDSAGNTGTATITLIKVPVTSAISDSLLSGTAAQINFITDFSAQGYVRYGTGNLGLTRVGTIGTTHNITLNNLTTNTTYMYQVAGIINQYVGEDLVSRYTGEFSATGTFSTPSVVVTTFNVTGIVIATGSVAIANATNTGVTFATTGILKIVSGSNVLQLDLSGLTIIAATPTWNKILLAPVVVSSGSSGEALFGKTGLPSPVETTVTRVIIQTIQAGGNVGLTAISNYFRMSFVVPTGTIGQVLKLYRSEDGIIWINSTPDASCTLDASLTCSFLTDHLSYFTVIKEIPLSTSTTAGGVSTLVAKDNCPLYGDLSPSYYDKTCDYHGAPSKWSEEMNMAYLYASQIGLTTSKNIESANIDGVLTRAQMAKMMSIYAVKVLKKQPDTSLACEFTDLQGQTRESKFYIKLACQLKLMGYMGDGTLSSVFNPKDKVARADFGTVLSRTLYNNKYDATHGAPYYQDHLTTLKDRGIINDITPTIKETIGTTLLILMRASSNK